MTIYATENDAHNAIDGTITVKVNDNDITTTTHGGLLRDMMTTLFAQLTNYTPAHEGADITGATDASPQFETMKTAIGSDNKAITLEPGALYSIGTNLTLPSNIPLKSTGGKIKVESGVTLRIESYIDAPHGQQVFDTIDGTIELRTNETEAYISNKQDLKDRVTHYQHEPISPIWFPGDDIGARVNAAFAAAGQNSWVRIPPGWFVLSTEIDLDEATVGSNVRLSGCGMLLTNLDVSGSIIGIDTSRGDEVTVDNMALTGTGQTGCALRIGNTTSTYTDLWISGCKYGIYSGAAGGTQGCYVDHCIIENNDYNIFIAARHGDAGIAGMDPTTNADTAALHWISNTMCFNGIVDGITIASYKIIEVDTIVGTWSIGDTITGSTSGATATLVATSAGGGSPWSIKRINDDEYQIGESITNGTATANVTDYPRTGRSFPLLRNITLSNVKCFSHNGWGIILDDVSGVTINGGHVTTNLSGGIKVAGGIGTVVGNVQVDRNTGDGIRVEAGWKIASLYDTSCSINVNGCVFDSSQGSAEQTTGIRVTDSTALISNNQFLDTGTTGINLNGGDDAVIMANYFQTDVTTPINITGYTGTHRVVGNIPTSVTDV